MLNHTTWELIDPSNARGGIVLTYADGQGMHDNTLGSSLCSLLYRHTQHTH